MKADNQQTGVEPATPAAGAQAGAGTEGPEEVWYELDFDQRICIVVEFYEKEVRAITKLPMDCKEKYNDKVNQLIKAMIKNLRRVLEEAPRAAILSGGNNEIKFETNPIKVSLVLETKAFDCLFKLLFPNLS